MKTSIKILSVEVNEVNFYRIVRFCHSKNTDNRILTPDVKKGRIIVEIVNF